MDNDTIAILKELYEATEIDIYQIHAKTKIPPTTLYTVLEAQRKWGYVTREGLIYTLTAEGQKYYTDSLPELYLHPSTSFKSVPKQFKGAQVMLGDVDVLNKIVQ